MKVTTVLIASLLLSPMLGCTRGKSRAAETPRDEVLRRRELKPRWKIPLEAREMLTRRMARHGDRMIFLMESVVLLNYELAESLADELAAEPKLGRPANGDVQTLEALLPEAFFDYQDELAKRGTELAAAARARDDAELTDALLGVTRTCVGCHAAYLYEGEEQEEVGLPDSPREGEEVDAAPSDSEKDSQ